MYLIVPLYIHICFQMTRFTRPSRSILFLSRYRLERFVHRQLCCQHSALGLGLCDPFPQTVLPACEVSTQLPCVQRIVNHHPPGSVSKGVPRFCNIQAKAKWPSAPSPKGNKERSLSANHANHLFPASSYRNQRRCYPSAGPQS